jgi:hypothetical protein
VSSLCGSPRRQRAKLCEPCRPGLRVERLPTESSLEMLRMHRQAVGLSGESKARPDATLSVNYGRLSSRHCDWSGREGDTSTGHFHSIFTPLRGGFAAKWRKLLISLGLYASPWAPMFSIFNLRPFSQAGRRGFDSRLPLHLFNYLARIGWHSWSPLTEWKGRDLAESD